MKKIATRTLAKMLAERPFAILGGPNDQFKRPAIINCKVKPPLLAVFTDILSGKKIFEVGDLTAGAPYTPEINDSYIHIYTPQGELKVFRLMKPWMAETDNFVEGDIETDYDN